MGPSSGPCCPMSRPRSYIVDTFCPQELKNAKHWENPWKTQVLAPNDAPAQLITGPCSPILELYRPTVGL